MAQAEPPRARAPAIRVQTIEATGKHWKGIQLACGIGMLVGMGSCAAGAVPAGFLVTIFSGFVFCLASIGAWWEHG